MEWQPLAVFVLYIDKSRLQGILWSFYGNYPKNSLPWEFSISMWTMVSYDLLLFMFKIETRPEEQIPCHSSFSNGIICGLYQGSFAVRDHLQSNLGIISSLAIICGRGSFAALCSSHFHIPLIFLFSTFLAMQYQIIFFQSAGSRFFL